MSNEEFNWNTREKTPRFSKKKIAAIIGIFFVLTVCIIIWQLPALAGSAWGLSFIERQINTNPELNITIGKLDLSWSGTQRAANIIIRDKNKDQIVNLYVKCSGSLIKWAKGSRDFGTVFVSGDVNIPGKSSSNNNESKSKTPIQLPLGFKAEIILNDLNIIYNDREQLAVAGIDSAALEDISGYITLENGKPLETSIRGITILNNNTGSFNMEGLVNNLITSNGTVTPDKFDCELKVLSSGLPTRLIDKFAQLEGNLTDAIGEMVDLDIKWSGSTTKGTATINVQSENIYADLSMVLANQRITVAKPGIVRWSILPGMIEKLPGSEILLENITLGSTTQIKLTINSLDYGLPLNDKYDMSTNNLSATLSLDSKLQADLGENLPTLQFDNFVININTDDPTEIITLSLDSNINVSGAIDDIIGKPNTAKFIINSELTRAFEKDGKYSPDTLGITGKLSAYDLPVAIADSIAGSDKLFVDLIGPVIDQFEVSTGLDSINDIRGRQSPQQIMFSLLASSDNMSLSGNAALKNGTIYSDDNNPIDVTLKLSETGRQHLQSLASQYQAQVSLSQIEKVNVHFNNFSIPLLSTTSHTATSAGAKAQITNTAWDGDIKIENLILSINDNQISGSDRGNSNKIYFNQLRLHTVSSSLQEAVSSTLFIDADYQNTVANITGQIDISKPIDNTSRNTIISLKAENLDAALIDKLAGLETSINEELLGNQFTMELKSNINAAISKTAELEVTGQNAALKLVFSENADGNRHMQGISRATITPELISKIQLLNGSASTTDAPLLLKPVTATINIENITLPNKNNTSNNKPAIWQDIPFSIDATLSTIEAANIPGIQTSQLGIDNLSLSATAIEGISDYFTYRVDGTILAKQTTGISETAAMLKLSGSGSILQDKLSLTGKADITSINLTSVEQMLELTETTLTKWTGNTADCIVAFEPISNNSTNTTDTFINNYKVSLDISSPRLSCDLSARLINDSITLTQPGTISLKVDHNLIQSMLTVPATSSEVTINEIASIVKDNISPEVSASANNDWKITTDINVAANITRLSIPAGIPEGKQINPTLLNINGDLRIDSLYLTSQSHAVSLNNLTFDIAGNNLTDGMQVKVAGKPVVTNIESSSSYTGSISLAGTIKSSGNTLGKEVYNIKGNIDGIPVSIIDNLANLNGKLTAALGSTMNVKLKTEDAGVESGTGSMSMMSENGKLTINKASWKDNMLTISEPVYAELNMTEEMSNSLLNNVNPILYDIEKKSGPITLNISALQLPFDGDLNKLNAEAMLDLGLIDMPSDGLMGDLLGDIGTTKEDVPERSTAKVPPVHITITNGKLHHDQLILQSDSFEIITEGDVYLAEKDKPLDLKLAMQLFDWKNFMSGVPSFGSNPKNNKKDDNDGSGVRFYFLVKGTVANPKPMPDPRGHIKVLEDIGKDAEDLIKDTANELLGDIFRK